MPKQTARLTSWGLIANSLIPGIYQIEGHAYGHPGFDDGEVVTTSIVVSIDFVKGIAETMNTVYELGEPV